MENLYLYEVVPSGKRWIVVNIQSGRRMSKYLKDKGQAERLANFLTKFIPELVEILN